MSREERRQYQRQMRNMERGPALPPAAKARAERNAARRAQRRGPGSTSSGPRSLSARFWTRTLLIAVVVGFLAFSLQWGNGMPLALYVGLAVAAVVVLVAVAFRFAQRRAAAMGLTPGADRPPR
jgi:Flp pilus assembly protein TadB